MWLWREHLLAVQEKPSAISTGTEANPIIQVMKIMYRCMHPVYGTISVQVQPVTLSLKKAALHLC